MIETPVQAIANARDPPRFDPARDQVKRRPQLELVENVHRLARAFDQAVIKCDRYEAIHIF